MGNSLILKEEEGDISGDGKFSGIPKFEMMASLGNFEMMASFGNFRTTRRMKSQNRKCPKIGVFYLLTVHGPACTYRNNGFYIVIIACERL